MKKAHLILLALVTVVLISSCTTYRGTAGGGCSVNRNLVGYR